MNIRVLLPIFFLSILLFIGCSEDSPEVEIPTTSEDPNAPEIPVEWKNWIKENSHMINSLTSEDYSDLQFLENILSNKRIVQLGESSHGAKEFNQAKVRLIKFLHEEMGFNVIAFESSVFDCFYAYNNELNNGAVSTMENSIFGVWRTEEVKELFTYLIETQSTENPLILAGFDIQDNSNGSLKQSQFLKDVFLNIDATKATELYDLNEYFIHVDDIYDISPVAVNDSLRERYQQYVDLLNTNWENLTDIYSENPQIPHIAKLSLLSKIKYVSIFCEGNIEDNTRVMEIRDSAMAYNLNYLCENFYANEKIMVWAHNTHIRHDNAQVKNSFPVPTMGYYIHELYGEELYTIGFYMYRGESAQSGTRIPIPVTPSTSENIEAILYRTRQPYVFVDLYNQEEQPGNSWMFQEMNAKHWGYWEEAMIPREQYDALFYVDETHMPNYLPYSSNKSVSKLDI